MINWWMIETNWCMYYGKICILFPHVTVLVGKSNTFVKFVKSSWNYPKCVEQANTQRHPKNSKDCNQVYKNNDMLFNVALKTYAMPQ